MDGDVADGDVLDAFEVAVVLAYAAHGEAQPGVPVLVLDQDVGAIGFGGDVVVAAVDDPVAEGDVVAVDDVGAVGVQRAEVEAYFLVDVGAVDVDVFEENALAVDYGEGPHLGLHEAGLLDDAVLHTLVGDLVRAAGVVVRSVDEIIPDLAVSIEGAVAETSPVNVLTAEDPSSGLILETNRDGVVEPVIDVGVPQERAMNLNINISQAGSVHDTANIVSLILLEHDLAAIVARLVAAGAKGILDRVRSVVGTGVDDARLGAAGGVDVAGNVGLAWSRQGQSRKA